MILELILIPFWGLINKIISLFPSDSPLFVEITDSFLGIIGKGINVIGPGTFSIVIANVLFWQAVQFGWVTIEWVYKKIPGVD